MHKVSDLVRFLGKVYEKEGIGSCLGTMGVWAITYPYIAYYHNKNGCLNPRAQNVQGSLMMLDRRDKGLSFDLLCKGIREPYLTAWWQNNLTKADIVYDIGANVGYYALQAARLAGDVVAVEPMPQSYETLRTNMALNHYKNAILFNYAVGAKEGMVKLYWEKHWNYASVKPATWIKETKNCQDVKLTTVDKLVRMVGMPPTIIRMDVEGYEIEIIAGAEKTLRDAKRLTIAMELHTGKLAEINYAGMKGMLQALKGYGFKVVATFKEPHPMLINNRIGTSALNFMHGLKGNKIGYSNYSIDDLINSEHFKQLDSGLQVVFRKA